MISLIIIEKHISTIHGLIIDAHDDQLPVGFIVQLVEHCTGIAEGRGQVLLRLEFFKPFFCYSSSSINNVKNHVPTNNVKNYVPTNTLTAIDPLMTLTGI